MGAARGREDKLAYIAPLAYQELRQGCCLVICAVISYCNTLPKLIDMFQAQALELCKRLGDVAEAESHHPDLHIMVKICRENIACIHNHLHATNLLLFLYSCSYCTCPSSDQKSFCWQGWNQVVVDVWTHARDGLTENDFILAAKLNKLPKEDLLRKPKKKMMDTY